MTFRKSPPPVKWVLTLDALNFYYWQSQSEPGEMVYKRFFPQLFQLADFLEDHYGKRFARKVIATLDNKAN
jgi:hypothetical protein